MAWTQILFTLFAIEATYPWGQRHTNTLTTCAGDLPHFDVIDSASKKKNGKEQ